MSGLIVPAPYIVPWIIRCKKLALKEAVWEFPSDGREITLTFDDGPSRFTPRLLDVLKDHGVHATFFILGDRAVLHPETLRRIEREDHQIGIHGFHHWSFHRHTLPEIQENMQRGRDIL